jgi:dTDP-glucose 4,6-dehydratase
VLSGHGSWRERTDVITHDLTTPFSAQAAHRIAGPGLDFIIATASESHVDRSITDPVPFVQNNVAVILHTLELARQLKPRAVIVVTSDEVYGPETGGVPHPEWDVILPSNPYAGSKACQEAIAISYWRTYGVPVVFVNCTNLFGERQDTEKFIPMTIRKISRGEQVIIHGVPGDIGTRCYLHCRNLADGICFLLGRQPPAMFPAHAGPGAPHSDRPDRYNIAALDRISNLVLAKIVADVIGRPLDYRLEECPASRPGHDPHYGLDSGKITVLGWKPPVPFEESLERTVRWSLANPSWLE